MGMTHFLGFSHPTLQHFAYIWGNKVKKYTSFMLRPVIATDRQKTSVRWWSGATQILPCWNRQFISAQYWSPTQHHTANFSNLYSIYLIVIILQNHSRISPSTPRPFSPFFLPVFVNEICSLLGFYKVQNGNSILTLWGTLLVPSYRVKQSNTRIKTKTKKLASCDLNSVDRARNIQLKLYVNKSSCKYCYVTVIFRTWFL